MGFDIDINLKWQQNTSNECMVDHRSYTHNFKSSCEIKAWNYSKNYF